MSNEEKQFIRVLLKDINNPTLEESFDFTRKDEYKTTVDAGYEDLDLREDAIKMQLYMQSDIITFNNNKRYQVVSREFQPCRPVMLVLNVNEIVE